MRPGERTSVRDLHRRTIARTKAPCHICGAEIDYELPYLHPMSFVVDHVIPYSKGGSDELSNKSAAHRQQPLVQSAEVRSHRRRGRRSQRAANLRHASGLDMRSQARGVGYSPAGPLSSRASWHSRAHVWSAETIGPWGCLR